jgi:hypothetical protein
MGLTAAALFGGFSLALLGLVLQAQSLIRYPSLVLLLLTVALIAFTFSVQFALAARSNFARPTEYDEWYPHAATDDRMDWQARSIREWKRWVDRARLAYNGGLLCLFAAVPLILIPADGASAVRWIAVLIGTSGFAGELAWTASSLRR